jgi:hypothetical protein
MWPLFVVIAPPRRHAASTARAFGSDQNSVEQLVAQPAVEALDEAVLSHPRIGGHLC